MYTVAILVYQRVNSFEKPNFISWVNSARTSLLIILIICCGGVPVLEQPSSSLVMEHDRMVWMLETLSRIKIPAPKLQTLKLKQHPRRSVLRLDNFTVYPKIILVSQGLPTELLDGSLEAFFTQEIKGLVNLLCYLGPRSGVLGESHPKKG